jgi:hypothetical protein
VDKLSSNSLEISFLHHFLLFFSIQFFFIPRNQEERMARLADIDANRIDRQTRRRQQRKLQTENFLKSLHMLQANNYLRDSEDSAAFEDYSIFMYRQNAPEFTDRVKELEQKLLYPVRIKCRFRSMVFLVPLTRYVEFDAINSRVSSRLMLLTTGARVLYLFSGV